MEMSYCPFPHFFDIIQKTVVPGHILSSQCRKRQDAEQPGPCTDIPFDRMDSPHKLATVVQRYSADMGLPLLRVRGTSLPHPPPALPHPSSPTAQPSSKKNLSFPRKKIYTSLHFCSISLTSLLSYFMSLPSFPAPRKNV